MRILNQLQPVMVSSACSELVELSNHVIAKHSLSRLYGKAIPPLKRNFPFPFFHFPYTLCLSLTFNFITLLTFNSFGHITNCISIRVDAGVYIVCSQNFKNDINGHVRNNGIIIIGGNLVNNSDFISGDIFVTGNTDLNNSLEIINSAGNKSFGNVNINNTGTFINSGNTDVTINGDLIIDGSFTPGSGTYTFTGTDKIISGTNGFSNVNGNISGVYTYDCAVNSSFNTLTVGNQMTIANDRGLNVNTSFTNSGTTLVDAGPNGHSGSLITPASITNTGICSFKTSISKNTWHGLSSPVTSAQIETVFTDLASHNNNFYQYDETSLNNYWVQQTTGTINPGQGYYLYYFNNKYKTYSGTFNTGNINVALSYSAGGRQGWNFVGNPYPSAIDWDAAGWTKTNIEDAVYVRNGAAWESYVSGIGDCRYIFQGQGFFVKALSGGGTLGFSNSVRQHRNFDNLKENVSVSDPVLKLSLSNGSLSNHTYIRLKTDATANFDKSWDALKIFSKIEEYPEIYSLASSLDSLSINSTPFFSNDTIIPLGIKIGTSGLYKIINEQHLNFNDIDIYLEDVISNTWTNLKQYPEYSFFSETYNGNNRFSLHFIRLNSQINQELISESSLNITQLCNQNNQLQIALNNYSKTPVTIELVDLIGKLIYKKNSKSDESLQFSINCSSISAGCYILRVCNQFKIINKKIFIK